MKAKILAFGEVMMRLEAPNYRTVAQTRSLDFAFSGTSVNVLSGLSHLGYQTELMTTLPENNLGYAAASYIRSLGVGTDAVSFDGDYIGMYVLEKGFGHRGSEVTYSNRSESAFCQSLETNYSIEHLRTGTHIHFCGISLAINKQIREVTLRIAEEAKAQGLTVSFDCNFRPKLWKGGYKEARPVYERMLLVADYVSMTEKDAVSILGMQTTAVQRQEQVDALLPKVAQRYSISAIAGTIRETNASASTLQGFLVQDGRVDFSTVHTVAILDRIGSGDGFFSGFLAAIFEGKSSSDIVEWATAAGVLAHTTYGDSPVTTRRAIEKLQLNQHIDVER
ncbi:sugar kinase [Shouchella miscanthi]|uniref:Sugar kinase n=1 Tax=Shouchella miscanthi TaxID=2598861 RepID=A0ABU6NPF6_9BACI|nr:sugar kinase [Shouchella miscanthi]